MWTMYKLYDHKQAEGGKTHKCQPIFQQQQQNTSLISWSPQTKKTDINTRSVHRSQSKPS